MSADAKKQGDNDAPLTDATATHVQESLPDTDVVTAQVELEAGYLRLEFADDHSREQVKEFLKTHVMDISGTDAVNGDYEMSRTIAVQRDKLRTSDTEPSHFIAFVPFSF